MVFYSSFICIYVFLKRKDILFNVHLRTGSDIYAIKATPALLIIDPVQICRPSLRPIIIAWVRISRSIFLLTSIISYFLIREYAIFNPYKPGVLFLWHRQTVQTQIRRRRTRRLIRVFTVCWQEFLTKIEQKWKSTPDTPKIGNGLVQLRRMDGSTRQMWVKEMSCRTSHIS